MANAKAASGHFRVLYFASAASFTKKEWDDFPAPCALEELPDILERSHPGFRQAILTSAAVTLNLDYIEVGALSDSDAEFRDKNLVIQSQDEVAIIPPVSSG